MVEHKKSDTLSSIVGIRCSFDTKTLGTDSSHIVDVFLYGHLSQGFPLAPNLLKHCVSMTISQIKVLWEIVSYPGTLTYTYLSTYHF